MEKTYSVAKIFYYPWYKGYDNDIALMKLTEEVELNEYVAPICMPTDPYFEFFENECVTTGWGKVDFSKCAYFFIFYFAHYVLCLFVR